MTATKQELDKRLREHRAILMDMVNTLSHAIFELNAGRVQELIDLVYEIPIHIRVQASMVDKVTIPLIIDACEEARKAGEYSYNDSQDCYEDFIA